MKRTVIEIVAIIVLSSGMGIIYKFFFNPTFPIFPQPEKIEFVSDTIFYSHLNQKPSSNPNDSTHNNQKESDAGKLPPKDTTRTSQVKSQVNPPATQANAAQSETADNKTFKFITYDKVLKYMNDKDVIIIDARSPEDYSKGHIGNAINIFPEQDNKDAYFRSLTALPQNKIYITYCNGGKECELSEEVAKDLMSFGFKRVVVYRGGWDEWQLKHKK